LNNTEGQGTYNADLLEQSVWVQIMDLTSGTLQHFQKKVVKVNKFAVLFVGKEGNAVINYIIFKQHLLYLYIG
jgi:hypothetical protein